jgi:hypothetical protein
MELGVKKTRRTARMSRQPSPSVTRRNEGLLERI